MVGHVATQIFRNAAGHLIVDGDWCDGATVQNTDTIYVIADDEDQIVLLSLNDGGYRPGKTNEPGTSDEIEFVLFLSGGTDVLWIGASGGADQIRFGHPTTGFAVGKVNLNAGETTGVDADVVLQAGADEVRVNGGSGADTISGAGGLETGEEFTLPMVVLGNEGADTLVGSTMPDFLYGHEGADTLKGRGGDDSLHTEDDVSGNDTANGGGGTDGCVTDPGDTTINCEADVWLTDR